MLNKNPLINLIEYILINARSALILCILIYIPLESIDNLASHCRYVRLQELLFSMNEYFEPFIQLIPIFGVCIFLYFCMWTPVLKKRVALFSMVILLIFSYIPILHVLMVMHKDEPEKAVKYCELIEKCPYSNFFSTKTVGLQSNKKDGD